ncbi:MAG: hypothetical protein Ct9H300mP28_34730 [Pseudomonadota bacterium]|nr:MAG: hypothetical protein Ct9H300mP28_34730 [Pseudomonadota bacterium]
MDFLLEIIMIRRFGLYKDCGNYFAVSHALGTVLL